LIIAAFRFPVLLYFLPLLSYDIYCRRYAPVLLIQLIPLAYHRFELGLPLLLLLILLTLLAWLLKSKNMAAASLRDETVRLRDEAVEHTMQLEHKNKSLLEKQDYEIHLATLNERNRIAREIHDHVGHLLTRALLQVGALRATLKDSAGQKQLETLSQTLTDSMNQIRTSLHDLHDEAIDFQAALNDLVEGFEACPVQLDYDIRTRPNQKCAFAFLAIVREALANIARHAQASQAWITVREHPGFYQLIIRDNGRGSKMQTPDIIWPESFSRPESGGIGLQNMVERIHTLQGQINFRREKGFEIFITVPKEQALA
jgi:signal transduction histidine kinase